MFACICFVSERVRLCVVRAHVVDGNSGVRCEPYIQMQIPLPIFALVLTRAPNTHLKCLHNQCQECRSAMRLHVPRSACHIDAPLNLTHLSYAPRPHSTHVPTNAVITSCFHRMTLFGCSDYSAMTPPAKWHSKFSHFFRAFGRPLVAKIFPARSENQNHFRWHCNCAVFERVLSFWPCAAFETGGDITMFAVHSS